MRLVLISLAKIKGLVKICLLTLRLMVKIKFLATYQNRIFFALFSAEAPFAFITSALKLLPYNIFKMADLHVKYVGNRHVKLMKRR